MTLTLPIESFVITSDYREEAEDIGELAASIKNIGLLQPIVVMRAGETLEILDGRRRFRALTEFLGITELELHKHFLLRDAPEDAEDQIKQLQLASAQKLVVQLVANIKRKDYKPLEAARLVHDIHNEYVTIYGPAVKGCHSRNDGWSLQNTADLIGRDKAFVSRMLAVVKNGSLVSDCKTLADAFDKITKAKSKQLAKQVRKAKAKKILENLDDTLGSYISNLHLAEARQFISTIEDESVDLILTDPPFGISLDLIASDASYDIYDDVPEKVAKLIEAIVPELYRVLKKNKYAIVWTGHHYLNRLQHLMSKAGFKVASTPLDWVKTDSPGKTMDANIFCGSMTQIAVYAYKGIPELTIKGRGNVFPYPIVRENRIHIAQMPEALVIDLLKIFSCPGDVVLDLFSGSGSVLRGCFATKRAFIGCEEIEDNYNSAISYTWDWARRQG